MHNCNSTIKNKLCNILTVSFYHITQEEEGHRQQIQPRYPEWSNNSSTVKPLQAKGTHQGITPRILHADKPISASSTIPSFQGNYPTDNDLLSRSSQGEMIHSLPERDFGNMFSSHLPGLKEKLPDMHQDTHQQPPLLPRKGISLVGQYSQTQPNRNCTEVQVRACIPDQNPENRNFKRECEMLRNLPNYPSMLSRTNNELGQHFTNNQSGDAAMHNGKLCLGKASVGREINHDHNMTLFKDRYCSVADNHSVSESSQHSVTPPLPPLSPNTTPPRTPPHSPTGSTLPKTTLSAQKQPVNFNHTPDLVTSASLSKSNVKKKSGKSVSMKTWDGHSKRTSKGQRKSLQAVSSNRRPAFSSKHFFRAWLPCQALQYFPRQS